MGSSGLTQPWTRSLVGQVEDALSAFGKKIQKQQWEALACQWWEQIIGRTIATDFAV